jgi:hypothetical protein
MHTTYSRRNCDQTAATGCVLHCGLLLCHFRDVTPRCHGNNAVADGCCAGGHLESLLCSRSLYPSVTTELEGGEWLAARPSCTLPPGKTRYPFYWRLDGPQGRSGRAENLVHIITKRNCKLQIMPVIVSLSILMKVWCVRASARACTSIWMLHLCYCH